MTQVAIHRLDHAKDLSLPNYATSGSAGMDLSAAISTDVALNPGERTLIPTGLIIALPRGYEAQIRPRSGLALKHGITVLNAPGTIDADYRGELQVILINHSKEAFTIQRGMRIAQMVIAPFTQITLEKQDHPFEGEHRGGGFGSTGVHAA